MLKGRLGLESARIPYKDRHDLVWLRRGRLFVVDGTLKFDTGMREEGDGGVLDIPFQMVTAFILENGTTVTHDALRLCARHGVGLLATGEDGVRLYSAMPFGPDNSEIARNQAILWADGPSRQTVARRLYAFKLGEIFPDAPIEVLRGMEGARAKETYRLYGQRFGIEWQGRHYDRNNPGGNDPINNAINHASVACLAAAQVATAAVGAIPQLGFIHADSGMSFCLDVADTYRDEIVLAAAFASVAKMKKDQRPLESIVRREVGRLIREKPLIPHMIDRIKTVLVP
jgi:CRISPR-associated protein Cas1